MKLGFTKASFIVELAAFQARGWAEPRTLNAEPFNLYINDSVRTLWFSFGHYLYLYTFPSDTGVLPFQLTCCVRFCNTYLTFSSLFLLHSDRIEMDISDQFQQIWLYGSSTHKKSWYCEMFTPLAEPIYLEKNLLH